ncbi:MAG: hypothetical protein HWD58_10870 [Bacteroidota bacterium]|nr:MAG: hypothetical protein HWD58_10870 [Bacteroidota bacterium]
MQYEVRDSEIRVHHWLVAHRGFVFQGLYGNQIDAIYVSGSNGGIVAYSPYPIMPESSKKSWAIGP